MNEKYIKEMEEEGGVEQWMSKRLADIIERNKKRMEEPRRGGLL
jgi:hypothetical protein